MKFNWKKLLSISCFCVIACGVSFGSVDAAKAATRTRRAFTEAEKAKLTELAKDRGSSGLTWKAIAEEVSKVSGIERNECTCKAMWSHKLKYYAQGEVKTGKFSLEEDRQLISQYKAIGPKYSLISEKIAGRTADMIKGRVRILKRHGLIGTEIPADTDIKLSELHKRYIFEDKNEVATLNIESSSSIFDEFNDISEDKNEVATLNIEPSSSVFDKFEEE